MKYHKIRSPFKRHTEGGMRGQLDFGNWSLDEFALLADVEWEWTEKIDGTNVRVYWDGHKPDIRGRTDNAQFNPLVYESLQNIFLEGILEDVFGETEVILYGEGVGPKIQNGGKYSDNHTFVLFDVYIGGFWLRREDVEDISDQINVPSAPGHGPMTPHEAFCLVSNGLTSQFGEFRAEGLVGTAPCGLFDRSGSRIVMKVKDRDFYGKYA